MNTIIQLTPERALQQALVYADIQNDEPRCLYSRYADGLYHFVVSTFSLKYEFYVDAETGEVPGISMEPLAYPEILLPGDGSGALSSVA